MQLHDTYNYYGCHRFSSDVFSFGVYAPRAIDVTLVGDFNDWKGTPMKRSKNGSWSTALKCKEGDKYQYRITGLDNEYHTKIDPYSFAVNYNKSIVVDVDKIKTNSKKIEVKDDFKEEPLNIYEIHLGSWCKDYKTYREIAAPLTAHLKEYHYNAVQFMPITEYPNDISWGYQVTGFFAPTDRYGSPQDLIYLIDTLHQAGIYVILDWVPAHFDKVSFGLIDFDGGSVYESAHFEKKEHPVWGTRYFDWSDNYVESFLISSAHFWLEKYGFDGLRIDTISSILEYVDADPMTGQIFDQVKNPEGKVFLRKLVNKIKELHPNAILIAEETRGYDYVTSDTGLGFTYKQGLGWTWDALNNFLHRNFHNVGELIYPMSYFYDNRSILCITHDQSGYDQGFALGLPQINKGLRQCFYAYMMSMPGKKQLFMGNELGLSSSWHYLKPLDWEIDEDISNTVKELNRFYLATPALWEKDYDQKAWELVEKDVQRGILAYLRKGKYNNVLCVFNFSDAEREYSLDPEAACLLENKELNNNNLPPYYYGFYMIE